MGSRSEPTN